MSSSRDEQLEALKSAVKSAESKLKSAEISAKDIEEKLKDSEENFLIKVEEKAAGYKAQTGANFSRIVDENGKAVYEFTRDTTNPERKKRRKLKLRRRFDSQTGKSSYKAEFLDSDNQTVELHSAKELKKPSSRKKFVAFNMFGIRRMDISTEVNNPFLDTIGKPIVVPIQAAAKLIHHTAETAKTIADTPIGKGIAATAKITSAPIVIPTKIIKDIADKGGIIHAVVDLGDKIKIEGVNAPKPIKAVGNVLKGAALGTETAAVETAKGLGTFSIEITKEQIYSEINKNLSENDAVKAYYIIGMKTAEVYSILAEHTRFRRAVLRDKAGDDITDVNVSRYLADKEEKQFQKVQKKLKNKKINADEVVNNARTEYEAAKARLEEYEIKHGLRQEKVEPVVSSTDKTIDKTTDEIKLTKTEKSIEKTNKKLKKVQKKIKPEPVSDLKTTIKRLDGLSVDTVMTSLRRKAIRDGGDNTGVEAANMAITLSQTAYHYGKKLHEKSIVDKESKYKEKLKTLENKNNFESKLTESSHFKASESSMGKNKKAAIGDKKQKQKKAIKKKHQKNVYKNFAKKASQNAKKIAASGVKASLAAISMPSGGVIAIVIVIIIILLLLVFALVACGGSGLSTVYSHVMSPCSTNTLGLCDRYYTELGKNMIDYHQNIKDYYVGYDKYVCLTEIDEITHSPEKLLPYLGIKAIADNGGEEWTYGDVTSYIEELFNEQYEFYTNEIHEIRKNVTTVVYSNEDAYYSALGESEYNLERPEGADIPVPLKSEWYTPYANTFPHVEILIYDGYVENTLDSVGVFTDKYGNTTEYDEMQTLPFHNYWSISLVFDWLDDHYEEYWIYREERQEYYEYDYFILEYAIQENAIAVDERYWTDTNEKWQDNNFDKLIYNHVIEFDDDMKGQFDIYSKFLMGHQILNLPFDNPVVTKYAGYDNHIYGDTALDYSIELQTYEGQEIICGMDGNITKLSDNSFSVYNSKYGTLYYDYVTVPNVSEAKSGDVISSSNGDTLRITFIDNNGDYLNPLFLFGS